MTNITYILEKINKYMLRYEVDTYNPELTNLLNLIIKHLKGIEKQCLK